MLAEQHLYSSEQLEKLRAYRDLAVLIVWLSCPTSSTRSVTFSCLPAPLHYFSTFQSYLHVFSAPLLPRPSSSISVCDEGKLPKLSLPRVMVLSVFQVQAPQLNDLVDVATQIILVNHGNQANITAEGLREREHIVWMVRTYGICHIFLLFFPFLSFSLFFLNPQSDNCIVLAPKLLPPLPHPNPSVYADAGGTT